MLGPFEAPACARLVSAALRSLYYGSGGMVRCQLAFFEPLVSLF